MVKRKGLAVLFLLLFSFSVVPLFAGGRQETEDEGKTKLLWWMHWADEPRRRAIFEEIKADYMATNSNVEIELVSCILNSVMNFGNLFSFHIMPISDEMFG